jgi:hypothetical protein
MVRVGHDHYAAALNKPHAREMNFTGKPMKGFESDDDLAGWVKICLDFVTTLPAK